jgi:hypothetical protein
MAGSNSLQATYQSQHQTSTRKLAVPNVTKKKRLDEKPTTKQQNIKNSASASSPQ